MADLEVSGFGARAPAAQLESALLRMPGGLKLDRRTIDFFAASHTHKQAPVDVVAGFGVNTGAPTGTKVYETRGDSRDGAMELPA